MGSLMHKHDVLMEILESGAREGGSLYDDLDRMNRHFEAQKQFNEVCHQIRYPKINSFN
jgi:hypothetical protein